MEIFYRVHALERMFERGISGKDIRVAIDSGEILEQYTDPSAYPGRLVFVQRGKGPLHVVVADNIVEDRAIIITCYRPDRTRWTEDFRRRRDEVRDV